MISLIPRAVGRLAVRIACLVLCAAPAAAGLVRGTVHEKGTPDPVAGAVARIVGSTAFAEADADGRFILEGPDGPRTLTIDAPGFEPGVRGVRLGETPFTLDVLLVRVEVRADEVVVRGRREAAQPSQTAVTREEIKATPGTAGDALRAVQNLPGVAMVSDFSGQMAVRGGGPRDNLYLLDRIPWPVPFHFGGIMSTVNSDLLQQVDLYAAGFDARWGNTDGAVLDAGTRPGAKDRLHGSANVSIVTAEGLVEGPVGLGDASWTVGGRRSYYDLLLGRMFRGTFTAFPRFWDLGGSVDASLSPHDRVRGLVLATDDLLGLLLTTEQVDDPAYAGTFHMHNAYQTGGVTWTTTRLPGVTSNFTPYAYDVLNDWGLGGIFSLRNENRVLGAKEDAAWEAGTIAGTRHTLGAGANVEKLDDRFLAFLFDPHGGPAGTGKYYSTTVTGHGVNTGAYIQDRVELGAGVAVTAGGRWDRSDRVDDSTLLPRASAEWRTDPRTTLRAAWGRYGQFPTGFELNPDYGNPRLSANLADHAVLGVERQFTHGLFGRVEVYEKRFRHLVVQTGGDRTVDRNYSNEGVGYARGAEIFLKESLGDRFFGWLSYAHSVSKRRDHAEDAWARYQYDQPNVATAIASYAVTTRWRLGTKIRWNSGPLVTPLVGRYQDIGGEWQGIYGAANSQRLADYIRCDARIEYAHPHDRWKLVFYFEMLNVFGRANPADLEYTNNYSGTRQINNLPRIPYLGVEARF